MFKMIAFILIFIFSSIQIISADIDLLEPFHKIAIYQGCIYFFEEEPQKSWHYTAFIQKKLDIKGKAENEKKFYIFPANIGLVNMKTIKWDISDNIMFLIEPPLFLTDPNIPFFGIKRFPIFEMQPNEPGTQCLSSWKRGKDKFGKEIYLPDEKGFYPPNYGKLKPVSYAYEDLYTKNIWFDICAKNQYTIELYILKNEIINIWLYDGTKETKIWKEAKDQTVNTDKLFSNLKGTEWKKIDSLDIKIEGPFRLLPNSDSAIVLHQNKWVIFEGLHGNNTKINNIQNVDGSKTLCIIANYDKDETLLYQDGFYNLKGEKVDLPVWGIDANEFMDVVKRANNKIYK